ncbi:hypothetical protein ACI65C_006390 [Semiaphis heraclei]
MSQSTKKKRPSGAEKQRIKKNKLLLENAKMCGDVRFMFAKAMDRVDEDNPSQKSTNQNISIDSLNNCKQYDDDDTGEDQTIDAEFNNVNKAKNQNVNVLHVKQSSNEFCNLNNVSILELKLTKKYLI